MGDLQTGRKEPHHAVPIILSERLRPQGVLYHHHVDRVIIGPCCSEALLNQTTHDPRDHVDYSVCH